MVTQITNLPDTKEVLYIEIFTQLKKHRNCYNMYISVIIIWKQVNI